MSKNKILAILASPHFNGITAKMLDYTIEALKRSGHQVTKINLYNKNLLYCKGCRSCLDTGICIINDDIIEISYLLKEADIIIVATPVYWANVPAILKNMFDRLLGVAMEETNTFPKPRLTGKRYLLLTSCKTPFPFSWIYGQSRGLVRNINEFFKTAGIKSCGKVICTNSIKKKELPKSLLRKIDKLINKI